MLNFLQGNDFLSALIAFGIVLIPAIIIHELGHFFAAKAAGITVLEFGVGFPPRAAKLFTWGETEFTLNWLPIGGFVRPLGEDFVRPVTDEEILARDRQEALNRMERQATAQTAASKLKERYEEASDYYREEFAARGIDPTKTKSVNEAKPLPRMFFMAAGSLANFLTAVIIFALLGMSGSPEFAGARALLTTIDAGGAFAAAGLQSGDAIEEVNGTTYDTSAALISALRDLEPGSNSLLTIRRGEETFDITWTVPAFTEPVESYVGISGISPDSPASAAGLQVGDLIVSINGTRTETTDPLIQGIQENLGRQVVLLVQRAGQTFEVRLIPRNPAPSDGAVGIIIQNVSRDGVLGAAYVEGPAQERIVYRNLFEGIGFGVSTTWSMIVRIFELPIELLRGTISPEAARPVGPVGISQVGGQIIQETVETGSANRLLEFAAIISIALGATNLLPIPALDGGRILFIILEIIRGRPVAPEFESVVHLIGLVFLLSIGVIVILNDIINPIILP